MAYPQRFDDIIRSSVSDGCSICFLRLHRLKVNCASLHSGWIGFLLIGRGICDTYHSKNPTLRQLCDQIRTLQMGKQTFHLETDALTQ